MSDLANRATSFFRFGGRGHVKAPAYPDGNPFYLRIAMAIVFASIAFEGEQKNIIEFATSPVTPTSLIKFGVFLPVMLAACLTLFPRFMRVAVILVIVVHLPDIFRFFGLANHTILAFWCVVPAVLFQDWSQSKSYANYLRITFGMVMIVACLQKVIAGTYINGAYLQFLVSEGKTTAQWWGFVCPGGIEKSCAGIVAASNVILVWQFIVGVFLIIGWKNIIVLIIEIGFLLGAGVFADEFNFQVLNIALLTIVFRTGVSPLFGVVLFAIIIGDIWGVGVIGTTVLGLVGAS